MSDQKHSVAMKAYLGEKLKSAKPEPIADEELMDVVARAVIADYRDRLETLSIKFYTDGGKRSGFSSAQCLEQAFMELTQ